MSEKVLFKKKKQIGKVLKIRSIKLARLQDLFLNVFYSIINKFRFCLQ